MRPERSARTFTGVDWRGERRPPLRPGDAVHFCDLRGCRLYKSDLAEVEFVGCRLNDASFRGAVLDRSRLVSCFAADTLPPLNLTESARAEMQVIDCHLHVVVEKSDDTLLRARWPTAVAEAVADTLDELPDVRYEACAADARHAVPGGLHSRTTGDDGVDLSPPGRRAFSSAPRSAQADRADAPVAGDVASVSRAHAFCHGPRASRGSARRHGARPR